MRGSAGRHDNTSGGQLIKLCDCTWKGQIKSRDSEARALTAGHYYLFLDMSESELTWLLKKGSVSEALFSV